MKYIIMKFTTIRNITFIGSFFLLSLIANAQKDYKLWLQYTPIQNPQIVAQYQKNTQGIIRLGNSESVQAAQTELETGLKSMLGNAIDLSEKKENNIIIGSFSSLNKTIQKELQSDFDKVKKDGYIIKTISSNNIVITGKQMLQFYMEYLTS